MTDESDLLTPRNSVNNHILDSEPAFSDDEEEQPLTISALEDDSDDDDDDIPLSKVRLKEKIQDKLDDNIDGPVGELLTKLQTEREMNKRCDLMDGILENLMTYEADDDSIPIIAKLLGTCFEEDFKDDVQVFPEVLSDDNLRESIKSPLFVLFTSLYGFSKQDEDGKEVLFKLSAEIRQFFPKIGYLLLYFFENSNSDRE